MRGDIGAGWEIGSGMGGARQIYASGVSMAYDQVRGVYVGEMTSRGGMYRVEGPDRASVSMQIDEILQYEYKDMMRELATQKQRIFGSDLGRTAMFSNSRANITRHRESGIPVMTIKASDHRHKDKAVLGDMLNVTELVMAALSIMHGQWIEALMSAMSMAFEDYLSKSGGHSEEMLYAVSFGGILITAKTRAMLKKKLQLQKNKRIQLIMSHMRSHEKSRNEATGGIGSDISGRLLEKKEQARRKWSKQISPQGQETRWKDRSLNLRKDIKVKRERAHLLWTERSI